MEHRVHFKLSNCTAVTATGYNVVKRELVTGHEGESIGLCQPKRRVPKIMAFRSRHSLFCIHSGSLTPFNTFRWYNKVLGGGDG